MLLPRRSCPIALTRPCTLPARRAALGQLHSVAVLFRTVPVVHHMLGPMDAQPRQRRQIVRQAKRKLPTGGLPLTLGARTHD
jgi:hypothetical protein